MILEEEGSFENGQRLVYNSDDFDAEAIPVSEPDYEPPFKKIKAKYEPFSKVAR